MSHEGFQLYVVKGVADSAVAYAVVARRVVYCAACCQLRLCRLYACEVEAAFLLGGDYAADLHFGFGGGGVEGAARGCDSYVMEHADSLFESLLNVLDDSGYEKMLRTEGSQDRLDNLAELKQSVYEFETTGGEESTLESYLSHVAMFTNSDMAEPGDKVRLMTIHTAKGLEFPYVFLCAMNEGVFPSRKTDTRERMEEERRLAFVALTRAEKGLYLSEASGRNFDGSNRYPSRFMLDIDPDALEWDQKPEDKLIQEAQHYIDSSSRWMISGSDLPQFQKGDRVRHPSFGRGTVVDLDQGRKAVIIKFDKLPTPRAISIRAKIEKE